MAMRVLVASNILCAICLLVFGCTVGARGVRQQCHRFVLGVLQQLPTAGPFLCAHTQVERPINSFPPIAMILLSFLSLGSAITGLVGGHKWAWCLDAFLVLLSTDGLCKMILVIVLWWVYLNSTSKVLKQSCQRL